MPKPMVQVKFTVDAETVSAFKARCAREGVSMASVVSQWMTAGKPAKAAVPKIDTRQHRRKVVNEMSALLEELLLREEDYRDRIPEMFQSRYEAADETCGQLSQALECLENAY